MVLQARGTTTSPAQFLSRSVELLGCCSHLVGLSFCITSVPKVPTLPTPSPLFYSLLTLSSRRQNFRKSSKPLVHYRAAPQGEGWGWSPTMVRAWIHSYVNKEIFTRKIDLQMHSGTTVQQAQRDLSGVFLQIILVCFWWCLGGNRSPCTITWQPKICELLKTVTESLVLAFL